MTTSSEEARRVYLEARELAEHMHMTDARRRYLRAVELDPGFALAHLGVGHTATTHEESRAAIQRAKDLVDGISEGERLMILAAVADGQGLAARQLGYLERLVELHADDARARTLLARYYFGRREFEAAAPHYERAVDIKPDHGFAWNQLGYCYRFTDRFDDAERAFKRYIELMPGEPNPHDSYAELLLTMGRHEASIAEYEKALQIDPLFVESYVGIGNNLIFLGRTGDARVVFQKLLDVARDERQRRTARRWIAASYLHENNHGKALAAVREMIDIAIANDDTPTAAEDLGLLGTILLDAGDPDEAMARFDEAIGLVRAADFAPDVLGAYERRYLYFEGLVALERGDLTGARAAADAYRRAVAGGDSKDGLTASELEGRVALAEGDFAGAMTALKTADQSDPRVLFLLAEVCRRAGDPDRAREICARVTEYRGLDFAYAFVRNRAKWLMADL